jgi:hypothetical protein
LAHICRPISQPSLCPDGGRNVAAHARKPCTKKKTFRVFLTDDTFHPDTLYQIVSEQQIQCMKRFLRMELVGVVLIPNVIIF